MERPASTPVPASESLDADAQIDMILEQSFPASDPPQWGSVRRSTREGDPREDPAGQ
jgi:hypothetical protein